MISTPLQSSQNNVFLRIVVVKDCPFEALVPLSYLGSLFGLR